MTKLGLIRDPQAWEADLQHYEQLLWTGQPEPGRGFRPKLIAAIFGGVLMAAGLSLIKRQIDINAQVGATAGVDPFIIIGIVMALLGLGFFFLPPVFDRRRLQRTRYALTSRRALIRSPKGTLQSWPLTGNSFPHHEQGDPGSVWFAEEIRHGQENDYTVKIGFEQIDDSKAVFDLLWTARETLLK